MTGETYYSSLPVLTEEEKTFVKMESELSLGVSGFNFGSMGGFYTFDEIVADLDTMFQLYPNLITEKYSIGTSHEGRTIWAVKISDNPNINEDEPTVGFDALDSCPGTTINGNTYVFYVVLAGKLWY